MFRNSQGHSPVTCFCSSFSCLFLSKFLSSPGLGVEQLRSHTWFSTSVSSSFLCCFPPAPRSNNIFMGRGPATELAQEGSMFTAVLAGGVGELIQTRSFLCNYTNGLNLFQNISRVGEMRKKMWLILIPLLLLSKPGFRIVNNIYLFLDVSCTGHWLVNFNWWNCDHLGY